MCAPVGGTVLTLLSLLSCTPAVYYSPPAQITMPPGPEPAIAIDASNRLLLAMSDAGAASHILSDVFPSDPGAEWRFTGLHPEFSFDIARQSRLDFYIRFYNHDQALRARGPVSFSVSIDGNRFESQRFSAPGDQEYRRPIPDGWIANAGPVHIELDIHPAWHASDGMTYGVLLNSIGFEKR